MRMMQYELKLNRDNGTGYYVSSCANEESVRLFSDKGRPIEMKILERRGGDLVSSIDWQLRRIQKEIRKGISRASGRNILWGFSGVAFGSFRSLCRVYYPGIL